MKPCLLLLLAFALPLRAEVQQQLEQTPYIAWGTSQPTLGAVLRGATPITFGGQRFIGYTRWDISWRFFWYQQSNGRCQIRHPVTRLNAQMTLPDLRGGNSQIHAQFDQYLRALKRHEMGHYAIAQAAANAIDERLRTLPEQVDCNTLQRVANEQAQGILEHYRQQEFDYDLQTGHGTSQGAVLPD